MYSVPFSHEQIHLGNWCPVMDVGADCQRLRRPCAGFRNRATENSRDDRAVDAVPLVSPASPLLANMAGKHEWTWLNRQPRKHHNQRYTNGQTFFMWLLTHQKINYPVFSLPLDRTQCAEELNDVGHVLLDGHQVQSCPRWRHANRRNIGWVAGCPSCCFQEGRR